MEKVRKLTNVNQRNTLLRCLHGDIYTNERLSRFGLRDNPMCDDCNEVDTLEHRLVACTRTTEILMQVERQTIKLGQGVINFGNYEMITRVMAAYDSSSIAILSLHAEMLRFIISKNAMPAEYFVNASVVRILKNDKNEAVQEAMRTLLNERRD